MRGKAAAARGAAPGDRARASRRRGSEVAGEGAGGLKDAGRGGRAENERTIGGQGTGIVQSQNAVADGGGAGVGVAGVAQVPLTGASLGNAGNVSSRATVSELRIEGVVTCGVPFKSE